MNYETWIEQNVKESLGQCEKVTEQMNKVFPELVRVRGNYFCHSWGDREHWWLVDSEGNVVDPTASQFPSRGYGVYVPLNEGDPEPIGRCMNCGEYVWTREFGVNVCSSKCSDTMHKYYGSNHKK